MTDPQCDLFAAFEPQPSEAELERRWYELLGKACELELEASESEARRERLLAKAAELVALANAIPLDPPRTVKARAIWLT